MCPSHEYTAYLASPKWQRVRAAMRAGANSRCEGCGRYLFGEHYQVHHVSYERLGHEGAMDLLVLCRRCHLVLHERYGGGSWGLVERRSADFYTRVQAYKTDGPYDPTRAREEQRQALSVLGYAEWRMAPGGDFDRVTVNGALVVDETLVAILAGKVKAAGVDPRGLRDNIDRWAWEAQRE